MQEDCPGSESIDESCVNNPINILDIGCRWGFADRFISIPDKDNFRIYGFDPDANECLRLQDEYQTLPTGYITCIPIALAGEEGKRNLYITSEPACSSLHPPIQFLSEHYPSLQCIQLDRIVTIDVVTLRSWAVKANVKTIDYIKLDTQGSELEILQGAGDLIATAICIDIEVEFNQIYQGQSLFGETDVYLRSKGFVLWKLSNLAHYSIGSELLPTNEVSSVCYDLNNRQVTQSFGGQLFWADARYIRSDMLARPTDDASQVNRCIRVFTALGMPDVVHQIKKLQVIS